MSNDENNEPRHMTQEVVIGGAHVQARARRHHAARDETDPSAGESERESARKPATASY